MIKDKFNQLKTGLKAKGKAKLGIYLHQKIGEFFHFDEQVVYMADAVEQYYHMDQPRDAQETSELMEHYIRARTRISDRYKQRVQKAASKLENHADELDKIRGSLGDNRFGKLLDGVIDPARIEEDVDDDLLEELQEKVRA